MILYFNQVFVTTRMSDPGSSATRMFLRFLSMAVEWQLRVESEVLVDNRVEHLS